MNAPRALLLTPLLLSGLLLVAADAAAQTLTYEQIRDAYARSYRYEQVDDYDNAVRALSAVIEVYPNGYTVNLRTGWLFYQAGRQANAIAHYETAMRSAPSALEARLGYLLPLLAQERYRDVETHAYQIVQVDHYNYYGNLRLAYALRMQAKLDQAEEIVRKMLAVYPTDTSFLVELGLVHVARDDWSAAIPVFRDVHILDPENATAKSYLGGD